MNRDPLYNKIVDRLSGEIDGNAFERCAQDLLREVYPTLAPVTGGNDAGMDGSIGTPEGPYALVCTTSPDVIGNFRKNTTTYLQKQHGPKRAVIATTQRLSPQRMRNLQAEAERLGIRIVNIHDGTDFANRLYRDKTWRLELLGITGDPPALSALPPRGRFSAPELVIGRDEALEWLQHQSSDLLLIGQPGSGKTHLHQYLAAQGLCLFAADGRPDRLADAIRNQSPRVIVVDDAHIRRDLLESLVRLRAELHATYRIHANCWPKHDRDIRVFLHLTEDAVRTLHPLSRKLILRLIEQTGIVGPDELLNLLLNQCDGKPGLAVAIAEACKRDGVKRVWTGEAIADQLLADRRLLSGERDRSVLAAFAVGGDAGMRWQDVSECLQISQIDLREITAAFGAGGVVEEVSREALQVRPPAIRAILVRDVFFSGPVPLDIEPLLRVTPSASATASVLMSARQRGAPIPQNLLERFLLLANSGETWEHFAWVNEACARAVIDHHPDRICDAAPGALHHDPDRAIRLLLNADAQSGTRAAEDPRRRISEWLTPIDLSPNAIVDRRHRLLTCLKSWSNEVGDDRMPTLGWALAELLTPNFSSIRTTPASHLEVTLRHGLLPMDSLKAIAGLWPEVLNVFAKMPVRSRRPVLERIEGWCLPQRYAYNGTLPDAVIQFMRDHGRQMLHQVLMLPSCTNACRTWARRVDRWAKLGLDVSVDPIFDLLFGERIHEADWEQEDKERNQRLQELSQRWATQQPAQIVLALSRLEIEATEFGSLPGEEHRWWLYKYLADFSTDPFEWAQSLMQHKMSPIFLDPFLEAVNLRDPERYLLLLTNLLGQELYTNPAIGRIITLQDVPCSLLETALARLKSPQPLGIQGLNYPRMPQHIVAKLLQHEDKDVRIATAFREWFAAPTGNVRPVVADAWRAAILEIDQEQHYLGDIFAKDKTIAFDWMAARIASDHAHLWNITNQIRAAVKVLGTEERRQLLLMFNRCSYDDDCFDLLIADDLDLFAAWLALQEDEYLKLRPLDRDADARWERMATIALDAGYTPEQIARHCTSSSSCICGSVSQYYLARVPAYEKLCQHPDPRLRPAGERGLRWVQREAESALESERREEVYGD